MPDTHKRNMMSMLPDWMRMAKDESSVGAKFLKAFGVSMADAESYVQYVWDNLYIGSADLTKADFCYKVPMALRDVLDANRYVEVIMIKDGEEMPCFQCETLQKFYESTEIAFIVDSIDGNIFIRVSDEMMTENIEKPFDALSINGTMHFSYQIHHTWNVFDEFGLLLGLRRRKNERNEPFKNRILSVFNTPAGSNKDGLKHALERECGINKDDIQLGSFTDDTFLYNEMIDEYGMPTEKYISYIEQINKVAGFSWDELRYGKAYWQTLEDGNVGIDYLPLFWGNDGDWLSNTSGVGEDNSLLVHPPKAEPSTREFSAIVGLGGTEEREEDLHPEISFKYRIYSKGKILNDLTREKYKYTVVSSEIIKLKYSIVVLREFLYQTKIQFDDKYPFQYEDPLNSGGEIVSGETTLHDEEDTHVKLLFELSTSDRTTTPKIHDITLEWEDTSGTSRTSTFTTDADFTKSDSSYEGTFRDTEATNNNVQLIKGSFAAVIDTYGAFLKGEMTNSIKANQDGSIQLDIR